MSGLTTFHQETTAGIHPFTHMQLKDKGTFIHNLNNFKLISAEEHNLFNNLQQDLSSPTGNLISHTDYTMD